MTSAGRTKEIDIEVGLHKSSALSPLLFVIIIPVQRPIEEIYLEEVITQLGKMKKNKVCGPYCLPIEVANTLVDEGEIWMTGVLNEAMK